MQTNMTKVETSKEPKCRVTMLSTATMATVTVSSAQPMRPLESLPQDTNVFHLPQIVQRLPVQHKITCMFLLDLTINKDNIENINVHMNYKYKVLQKYVHLKSDRPECHAIHNLLGVLAARLGRYKEAMDFFMLVLEKDPTNINAIANARWLWDTLTHEDTTVCPALKDRLHQMVEAACNKLLTVLSDQQWCNIIARCLAEQAYAYTFQPWDDEFSVQRYHIAHDLYDTSMTLLGTDSVNDIERQDWEFQDAITCKLIAKMEHKSCPTFYQISFRRFHKIVQTCDNDHMISESWRYIGEICKFADSKTKKEMLEDLNFGDLSNTNPIWQWCLDKALEVNPGDSRLLARKAQMIRHTSCERALQLLDESIDIDNSEYNRFAFVIRGEIYLKNAQRSVFLDSALLERAKADFEHALSLNETSKDLAHLATIWKLLAQDGGANNSSLGGKTCMEKALEYYEKAVNCQNGVKSEEINRLRGMCLFEAGQYDVAIESFQRAIGCQTNPTDTNLGNFTNLMRVYLTAISESKSDKIKRRLLRELAKSAKHAIRKYPEGKLRDRVSQLWLEFPEEMNFFLSYCDEMRCQEIVQMFSGQYYATEDSWRIRARDENDIPVQVCLHPALDAVSSNMSKENNGASGRHQPRSRRHCKDLSRKETNEKKPYSATGHRQSTTRSTKAEDNLKRASAHEWKQVRGSHTQSQVGISQSEHLKEISTYSCGSRFQLLQDELN
ncbi:tetratricopeptide repeat protein 22-like [Amphiura filiformis]|uniref:tetratricopeptide repeat protein 22-like n=1 Tax=Amphiura filiformis TaxID=82378 RepID=UPI003B2237F1